MATTLNSTTLADPFEINIESSLLGTTKRSANGTIITDYLYGTLQRKISLSWRLISSTDRDTIVTKAKEAIATARTLVIPDGRSMSVWFPADAPIVETQVRSGSTYLYNLQATFLEDLVTT